jgi:hypothetical protein
MTRDLQSAVGLGADSYRKALRDHDRPGMYADALAKVIAGTTTLPEVLRLHDPGLQREPAVITRGPAAGS